MRLWTINHTRTPQVGGWLCSVIVTICTARQFTDEQHQVDAGGRWRWLAFWRAMRAARALEREIGAKRGERAKLGWLVILTAILLTAPAFASEPPKAANCPAKAAAPVFVLVRPATIGERILERRMARLADQYAPMRPKREADDRLTTILKLLEHCSDRERIEVVRAALHQIFLNLPDEKPKSPPTKK